MSATKLTMSFFIVCLALGAGMVRAEDLWLKESVGLHAANWPRLPSSLYLDLGRDRESLKRLDSALFVIDEPEVIRSEPLVCDSAYRKYLIRSFYLDRPDAIVYQSQDKLIVSVGSSSTPRQPDKATIAICLLRPPSSVEAIISYYR